MNKRFNLYNHKLKIDKKKYHKLVLIYQILLEKMIISNNLI